MWTKVLRRVLAEPSEEIRMKAGCGLTSSTWIRLQEVSILKTQQNLGKGFQATIGPIPGTQYSVRQFSHTNMETLLHSTCDREGGLESSVVSDQQYRGPRVIEYL